MKPYRGSKVKKNRLRFGFAVLLAVILAVMAVVTIVLYSKEIAEAWALFVSYGTEDNVKASQENNPDIVTEEEEEEEEEVPSAYEEEAHSDEIPVKEVVYEIIEESSYTDTEYLENLVYLVETGQINAVIFDVKTEYGVLGYPSQIEEAVNAGLVSSIAPSFLSAFEYLKANDVYMIARMTTFPDDGITRVNRELSVKYDVNTEWLDFDYKRHLDPYEEGSIDYIASITEELSDLGFNEIAMASFAFPIEGRTELIYHEDTRVTKEQTLLNAFNEIDERTSAHLSIWIDYEVDLQGKNIDGGVDLALLYEEAYRMYATEYTTDIMTVLYGRNKTIIYY